MKNQEWFTSTRQIHTRVSLNPEVKFELKEEMMDLIVSNTNNFVPFSKISQSDVKVEPVMLKFCDEQNSENEWESQGKFERVSSFDSFQKFMPSVKVEADEEGEVEVDEEGEINEKVKVDENIEKLERNYSDNKSFWGKKKSTNQNIDILWQELSPISPIQILKSRDKVKSEIEENQVKGIKIKDKERERILAINRERRKIFFEEIKSYPKVHYKNWNFVMKRVSGKFLKIFQLAFYEKERKFEIQNLKSNFIKKKVRKGDEFQVK